MSAKIFEILFYHHNINITKCYIFHLVSQFSDWITSITSQAQAHINSLAQYMPVSGPMDLAPVSWTFSSFSEEFSEAMDTLTNAISGRLNKQNNN